MNASRRRKVAYIVGIVAIFSMIVGVRGFGLAHFIETTAEASSLAQKSLGEVNPVSGTAQLVFLGFRGVAVTFLWNEAIELKRKERWFEIEPVLNSITLLQPNFINPWTFQAWNMAYNIAAEWESVRDKYYWINRGIVFMKNACAANAKKCDLQWYTGWLYFNRFGVSDEKTFLRQLFFKDPDTGFTIARNGVKDSYEVAGDWFNDANDTIRTTGILPKSKGVTPFMSYPAVSKAAYADTLGKEGVFGEKTKNAWLTAHQEWLKFGREGGPNRNDPIHRLEYSSEEWAKLTDEQRYWANHYAKIVNYYYWKKRTRSEATDEMQAAREAFYKANKAREEGNYLLAIAEYEKAFPLWRKIIENDDNLRNDFLFVEDSQLYEARYLQLLTRLNRPLPQKRPFDGLFPEMQVQAPTPGRDLERRPPQVGGQPAGKKDAKPALPAPVGR